MKRTIYIEEDVDKLMRVAGWILIEAANTASRTDDRLRKFYIRLVKRHGRHIAIAHVANKM
jgi:hypothetical protein